MEGWWQVAGIDGHRVTRWLEERVEFAPPLRFQVATGGRSNLTYFVTDAEFVAGEVIREKLTEDGRQAVAYDLVDVLARLHAVDPDAVGLGGLGRRDDYVGRQLRRWRRRQLAQTQTQTRDLPVLAEVHDRLAAAIPEQRAVAFSGWRSAARTLHRESENAPAAPTHLGSP